MKIRIIAPLDDAVELRHGYTHGKDGSHRYYVEGCPTQVTLRVEAHSPSEAMEFMGRITEHVDATLLGYETQEENGTMLQDLAEAVGWKLDALGLRLQIRRDSEEGTPEALEGDASYRTRLVERARTLGHAPPPFKDRAQAFRNGLARLEQSLGVQIEHEDSQGAFLLVNERNPSEKDML